MYINTHCLRISNDLFGTPCLSNLPYCATTDHTSDNMTKTVMRARQHRSPIPKEPHDNKAISIQSCDASEQCACQTTAGQTTSTKIEFSERLGLIRFQNITASSDAHQVVVCTRGCAMIAENITASRGATQIIGIVSEDTFDQIVRHHKSIAHPSRANELGDDVKLLSLR